jgi:hypothetical protein
MWTGSTRCPELSNRLRAGAMTISMKKNEIFPEFAKKIKKKMS